MTRSLLSDSGRAWKLSLLAVLLLGLCGLYGWQATQRPVGWMKCMADPEASDGARVVLSLYEVDGVDEAGHMRVSKVARGVPVDLTELGDSRVPEPGQTVSVVGVFRASDQVLVAEKMEVHLLRWVKVVLGWVGLAVVMAGIPLSFRYRNGRLEEKWRTW